MRFFTDYYKLEITIQKPKHILNKLVSPTLYHIHANNKNIDFIIHRNEKQTVFSRHFVFEILKGVNLPQSVEYQSSGDCNRPHQNFYTSEVLSNSARYQNDVVERMPYRQEDDRCNTSQTLFSRFSFSILSISISFLEASSSFLQASISICLSFN